MPQITLSSTVPVSAARLWDEVVRPRLFLHVAGGQIRFDPVDPPQLPDKWAEGDYVLAMRGYGFIPLGSQTVSIELPGRDGDTYRLRDNGHGLFFPEWDHRISVSPIDDSQCRYTDAIEFTARLPDFIAKKMVGDFFRQRQARMRALIANDFRY